MIAVSIKNLSKTYPPSLARVKKFFRLPIKPAVEALKNISFDIGDGEIFGLIGKNGAGKTTLTKIIATLVQPTDRRVSVKNLLKCEICFVFFWCLFVNNFLCLV